MLETWLWDAACAIRGSTDAPKFKDFILPLVFFKRLSDVFDDEFATHVKEYGDETTAREIIEADLAHALKTGTTPIIRFYIPKEYNWKAIRNHGADGRLGEFITGAMREVAKLNPDLQGVLDIKDYNERQSGQRTLDDDPLASLIEILSRHRLGLKNTEPDILGRAYEYLLRKFAEGQGQSAGEFLTPKEVGELMAELIDPRPYTNIDDPTCGTGGLLIKSRMLYEKKHTDEKSKAPRLWGQELNPMTFAMAKMNMFLHDYTDSNFAIGDTFRKPGFGAEGSLMRFDYVVANPMWNQDNYDEAFYENDTYNRFNYGIPPKSSADWGWVQHMFASLNENGRAAIVLDTGAVSRGSGSKASNKEKKIRSEFIEHDFIEGVVLLPDNLFYNTTAPGIILLLNSNKPGERKGQMLLVNASNYFVKEKPKNVLTVEGIQAVAEVYRKWETREKLSRVITLEEAREADYNLSPSQFVEVNDREKHRPMLEILSDLKQARAERERADDVLAEVLRKLKL
ncbi:MAG: N-6 DNA methylase [Methanotrichaceae archaeon]|jgi:type I restriction enzyme M protein